MLPILVCACLGALAVGIALTFVDFRAVRRPEKPVPWRSWPVKTGQREFVWHDEPMSHDGMLISIDRDPTEDEDGLIL